MVIRGNEPASMPSLMLVGIKAPTIAELVIVNRISRLNNSRGFDIPDRV